MRLAKYDAATSSLSRALSLAPNEIQARLERATAYLGAGQLDAAGEDYNELFKMDGWSQQALFGLAGIAWRKKDTNAATGFYQRYLSNAPPGSAQAALALERLKTLVPSP
jgi:Tfp pilus assembly protein PilF